MKKLTLIATLYLFCLQVSAQPNHLDQMTTKEWVEDLEYLNKKIQKEFQSFLPGIKDEFDEEVNTLKSKLPELQYYMIAGEFMRLLSTLQDGHTELNPGHKNVGFHRVPLSLYFFQNELYILAAHEGYADLIGGKIAGIGDVSMEHAFNKLRQNMSRDNKMEYLHAGPGYLILTELLTYLGISINPTQVTFIIELPDGNKVKKKFQGIGYSSYNDGPWVTYYQQKELETPLYLTHRESQYWYTYLKESKTMYFNFTRVNNQKGKPSIKKFISELFDRIDERRPEKLVIDFRLNNGGNYNLSRPLVESIKSRGWLNQRGKVWAVTGRRTFSAASVACVFLKQETATQIIGEVGRTHPNWADNNEYMNLPNSGFLIEYTTKIKTHWPEQPGLDHVPVDIEITPSFEKYKQGADPVLEYLLGNVFN